MIPEDRMSTAPKDRMTEDEYLERERASDRKSEFLDGEMFALAGASPTHALITSNVGAAFHQRLRERPCRVFSPDLRLRVSPSGLFCYPDVVVVCGELQFSDAEKDTVTNPLLVVEVLSPSTEGWDRGGKFARYRMLESLREVVFVSQGRVLVEQFTRQADGRWILTEATRLDEVLAVESVACDLPVSEVYEKVDLGGS